MEFHTAAMLQPAGGGVVRCPKEPEESACDANFGSNSSSTEYCSEQLTA